MCSFANNRTTVCGYFILKVWASRRTFIISTTFKSKTEPVRLSNCNYVFLRWLLKSTCFRTVQKEVGNFKCLIVPIFVSVDGWKHVGASSHARMATRAEMKCAAVDLRWGTTKLHFCKLATQQEVARSFAAFQAERTSTLCAGFVSTGGCSRGERWFPWLPGADFSTTQPYLACCTGNQICLSGTLSPSPAFGTIH